MSKYKLIKEYPNSPKIGYKIAYGNYYDHCGYMINGIAIYPEKYPEFWEEIIDKDYEILSFYYKNIAGKDDSYVDPTYLWYETSKGNDKWSRMGHITHPYNTDEILQHPNYGIHSVKRLSDGEIFTIGDKVDINDHWKGLKIESFELNEKGNRVMFVFLNTRYKLEDIKIKQLLFKTEDHVAVFKGDIIHIVTSWLEYSSITAGEKTLLLFPNRKMFSTKEAAEEYILMNKPCLCIKEIAPIFGMYHLDNSKTSLDRLSEKLKEVVKSKLK